MKTKEKICQPTNCKNSLKQNKKNPAYTSASSLTPESSHTSTKPGHRRSSTKPGPIYLSSNKLMIA